MDREKSSDRGRDMKTKTDGEEKKDFLRQRCGRLHLDSSRDHYNLPHRSFQKLGTEKTNHPVESRKEGPSLPDDQRHQALLSRNNEMIPARVIQSGKQGETYVWKPLPLEEMRKSDAVFISKYVRGCDYPIYCESVS
jgi:hypothetical protein